MVDGTVFCLSGGLFWKKGTQYKKFAFLKFRSLKETFLDFSQKNLQKFVKTTFKVSRGTLSEKYFFKKIWKLVFFGVWTEKCLTSARTFFQSWQPCILRAQKTNMIIRFFSEEFVTFSSFLYSEGKFCCFLRKLFGRFKFPEEMLVKNMLRDVFFVSNPLEIEQFFYSVLEKKIHQFRQLCILRAHWTIFRKNLCLKKKWLFVPVRTLRETFAAFWQNVSNRLIELRFTRPQKHFQKKIKKRSNSSNIMDFERNLSANFKILTKLSSFHSTGLKEYFQEKFFF